MALLYIERTHSIYHAPTATDWALIRAQISEVDDS